MWIERASLVVNSLSAIQKIVLDTLETLTFVDATPLESLEGVTVFPPLYITTVDVRRPYFGCIKLILTRAVAVKLISAMLGRTDVVEDEWLHDGLSELVNVLGGRILANLASAESSFDLGIPSTIFVTGESPQALGLTVRQVFQIEGDFLELDIEFRQAAAA